MIIALHTSHINHGNAWKQLLVHITTAIHSALEKLESFKRLSDADREAVMGEGKMKSFVNGISKIIELGQIVATSCLEALIEVDSAYNMLDLCLNFVFLSSSIWGGNEVIRLS